MSIYYPPQIKNWYILGLLVDYNHIIIEFYNSKRVMRLKTVSNNDSSFV